MTRTATRTYQQGDCELPAWLPMVITTWVLSIDVVKVRVGGELVKKERECNTCKGDWRYKWCVYYCIIACNNIVACSLHLLAVFFLLFFCCFSPYLHVCMFLFIATTSLVNKDLYIKNWIDWLKMEEDGV